MRYLILGAVLSFFSGSVSVALPLPCVPGTVASYVALGTTGCTVGPLTFSLFTYTIAQSGPSSVPTDTQSQLQPISDANGFGFIFVPNANSFLANPTGVADAQLQYVVGSTNGTPIIKDVFAMVAGTATNSSVINVLEMYCLGKTSLPAGSCSPTALTLDVLIPGAPSATQVFTATNSVAVNKDIVANSNPGNGQGGNIVVSQVINEWSVTVPEPGTVLLLVSGLALLPISRVARRRV